MLAGAIQQYLKANGMALVYVSAFGDYTAATAVAVAATLGRDATLDDESYYARVQIRARAANAVAAENAARQALELLLAADGLTLEWDDPTNAADRSYLIEAISIVNRPTWYPTLEQGEECSCNVELFATET